MPPTRDSVHRMHDPEPAFRAPEGACDTHFHIFGPLEEYPVASRARYDPPFAPLHEYLSLAELLGIERMVVVQPSAYGADNRCTLDALEALGSRARAIVDIPEELPDDELTELDRRGVRGVRINTAPYAPYDPGRARELLPRIEKLASRLQGSGWCLEFLGPGWLTEALIPTMRTLKVDFIVDHLGTFPAERGVDQPGFQSLLKLAEGGNCWIKMTAPYRFATAPDYRDATPMARAVVAAVPDRLLWGSDYPHLSYADKVGSVELFNLLPDWLPTEELRRKVLVANPQALFGF